MFYQPHDEKHSGPPPGIDLTEVKLSAFLHSHPVTTGKYDGVVIMWRMSFDRDDSIAPPGSLTALAFRWPSSDISSGCTMVTAWSNMPDEVVGICNVAIDRYHGHTGGYAGLTVGEFIATMMEGL